MKILFSIGELNVQGFGYSGVMRALEPALYLVMTIGDLFCYRLLEGGVRPMDHTGYGHTEPLQARTLWLRWAAMVA